MCLPHLGVQKTELTWVNYTHTRTHWCLWSRLKHTAGLWVNYFYSASCGGFRKLLEVCEVSDIVLFAAHKYNGILQPMWTQMMPFSPHRNISISAPGSLWRLVDIITFPTQTETSGGECCRKFSFRQSYMLLSVKWGESAATVSF